MTSRQQDHHIRLVTLGNRFQTASDVTTAGPSYPTGDPQESLPNGKWRHDSRTIISDWWPSGIASKRQVTSRQQDHHIRLVTLRNRFQTASDVTTAGQSYPTGDPRESLPNGKWRHDSRTIISDWCTSGIASKRQVTSRQQDNHIRLVHLRNRFQTASYVTTAGPSYPTGAPQESLPNGKLRHDSRTIISDWCTSGIASKRQVTSRQQDNHIRLVHLRNRFQTASDVTTAGQSYPTGAPQESLPNGKWRHDSRTIISDWWPSGIASKRQLTSRQQDNPIRLVHLRNRFQTASDVTTAGQSYPTGDPQETLPNGKWRHDSRTIISDWCTSGIASKRQVTSRQQDHHIRLVTLRNRFQTAIDVTTAGPSYPTGAPQESLPNGKWRHDSRTIISDWCTSGIACKRQLTSRQQDNHIRLVTLGNRFQTASDVTTAGQSYPTGAPQESLPNGKWRHDSRTIISDWCTSGIASKRQVTSRQQDHHIRLVTLGNRFQTAIDVTTAGQSYPTGAPQESLPNGKWRRDSRTIISDWWPSGIASKRQVWQRGPFLACVNRLREQGIHPRRPAVRPGLLRIAWCVLFRDESRFYLDNSNGRSRVCRHVLMTPMLWSDVHLAEAVSWFGWHHVNWTNTSRWQCEHHTLPSRNYPCSRHPICARTAT